MPSFKVHQTLNQLLHPPSVGDVGRTKRTRRRSVAAGIEKPFPLEQWEIASGEQ
jgi:hypothetical protein